MAGTARPRGHPPPHGLRWGGPIEEIRPGDVVWFSPRRKALARRNAYHGNDAKVSIGWRTSATINTSADVIVSIVLILELFSLQLLSRHPDSGSE